MPIINRIADFHADLTAWRRELHRHPETAFEEEWPSALVAEKLESFGLEVHRGIAKTGLVAVLRGPRATGRAIGLRADMAALAITETPGLPYASGRLPRPHACVHARHPAMVMGAATHMPAPPNYHRTP